MGVAKMRQTGKLVEGTKMMGQEVMKAMTQGAGHTKKRIKDDIKHV